jgi:DNA-directed RNA polymerase sigma subunit (sigma70/sigma32)
MTRARAGDQVRAALSFTEIGVRLGISRQSAQQCCKRALRKLFEQTPNTVGLMQVYAEDLVDRRSSPKTQSTRKRVA